MEDIKKHQPGTFSWIDLATTDSEAAKSFYSALFDLKPIDTPAGPEGVYTMLTLREKPVAALYQITRDQLDQGQSPHWDSYVTVENVDEAVEVAGKLGGSVHLEPFDVYDSCRLGLIQDPTGAILALWEPKKDIGAHFKNRPGSLCWNELVTTDTDKAKSFYTQLFAWESHTSEMIGIVYTAFLLDNKPVAGMYRLPDTMAGTPSHWMPYLSVADCDGTVQKARDLSATVVQPPKDIPRTGRFSVLKDPQGAVFAVLEMAPMEE